MGELNVSPALVQPAPELRPQGTERMRETAEAFEASFISQMLKPMFDGLSTEGPFGGGAGEEAWRGILIDAMAQKVAKSGGIGLSDTVVAEMVRMQALGAAQ